MSKLSEFKKSVQGMSSDELFRALFTDGRLYDDLEEALFEPDIQFNVKIEPIVRYSIHEDGDGHSWCVPVDKSDEFSAILDRIGEYWSNSGTMTDDHAPPPEIPDYAISFEGRLSFTDPKTD